MLSGGAEAFERFVEHFRSKIFRYSWLMCGNADDAEEVAQETLLAVFARRKQLRDPEAVRAWVFRIARNTCLMQRRRSVYAPSVEVSLDELLPAESPADGEQTQEAVFLSAELRAVLDRALTELPPLYRPVVILRDIEELTTEETAQILDLSPDVVKTRLHRGRSALRQTLECYVHNRCLDDQPAPSPKPLSRSEHHALYSAWRAQPAPPA
jgi:RNA polymerase sigma-70 factor, ECF subfamily